MMDDRSQAGNLRGPAQSGTPILLNVWDTAVSVAVILAAFAIPHALVLRPGSAPLGLGADLALTSLLTADFAWRLHRRRAGLSRDRSWLGLAVDAVAALPLGLMLGMPQAHLLRLVKLTHLFPNLMGWRHDSLLHPIAIRLAFFAFWLGLSAHWLACGWIVLEGASLGPGTDDLYLDALYWCVTTLTTVGYGDVTPATSGQAIYSMIVMILGVGVYGYVIGNVASLLSRMDTAKTHYVATMERLAGFFRYRRVPQHLQRHVFDYYRYLWEHQLGYDESTVLNDLPTTLRREMSLVLKRGLVRKVSFLKDASLELVQDLCVEMRAAVYTPGDVIVRAGEFGRHVYFISKGTVEVIDPDGATVLRRLSDGDFFGELALLHRQRRSATVRALEYCDVYILDREAFDRTLALYPDFAENVRRISEERTPVAKGSDPAPRPSS
jgi:voltage-gated potassium channel